MVPSKAAGGRRRWLRTLAWFAGLTLLALGAWLLRMRLDPREVPSGQEPLSAIDESSLPAFHASFNAASAHTRIVVLLSPT